MTLKDKHMIKLSTTEIEYLKDCINKDISELKGDIECYKYNLIRIKLWQKNLFNKDYIEKEIWFYQDTISLLSNLLLKLNQ